MRLFLVVQNEGKQKGMRIPVPGELFLVGRDPECQLRPASSIISKKHCGFINLEKDFFLEDYQSTNGTILNGNRVEGKVALKSGDNVTIGPLEFIILIEPKLASQSGDPKSGMIKGLSPSPSGVRPAPLPTSATSQPIQAKPAVAPMAVPPISASASVEAAAKASKNALDDDIAALLLGGDEGGSGSEIITGDGTTVVDLSKDLSSTPPSGNPAVRPATAGKPISSTTDAAKALLEKYMRRPRAT